MDLFARNRWISAPLDLITHFFDNSAPEQQRRGEWGERVAFETAFPDPASRRLIPSLNSINPLQLENHTLVEISESYLDRNLMLLLGSFPWHGPGYGRY